MDGGSTDNTINILKKYDKNIIWVSEPDRGQSHALNKALAMATGEIIGWCNADDIYFSNAILKAFEIFSKHKEVAMIYARVNIINESSRVIRDYPVEPFNYQKLLREKPGMIASQGVFIKKNCLLQVGGFNESLHYAMDYDLWLKIGKVGEIVYLPEVLAGFRVYGKSKTQSFYWKTCKEVYIVSKMNGVSKFSRFLFKYYVERAKAFVRPIKRYYEKVFGIERKF